MGLGKALPMISVILKELEDMESQSKSDDSGNEVDVKTKYQGSTKNEASYQWNYFLELIQNVKQIVITTYSAENSICQFTVKSRWTSTDTPLMNKGLDCYSLTSFLINLTINLHYCLEAQKTPWFQAVLQMQH